MGVLVSWQQHNNLKMVSGTAPSDSERPYHDSPPKAATRPAEGKLQRNAMQCNAMNANHTHTWPRR